ncbi:MAG TPA: adenylosuccinate synthase [Candidatus Omnitrophota bacterium]|nr:adenylosuccinate synthase [Candidatus Omnitrophota bacterium]
MSNRVLIGAQWGDEGKGKVIDFLARQSDVIVRYQGGHNAGHTVKFGKKKFVLHLIPSGIFHRGKVCVIGGGVVLNPHAFLEEVHMLEKAGIKVRGRLFVADQAHLIMPYHGLLDGLKEEHAHPGRAIGTTKKGIGPCYTDKMARTGIRLADLRSEDYFRSRLEFILNEKNEYLKKIYGAKPLSYENIFKEFWKIRSEILSFAIDCPKYLNDAIKKKKEMLFEGAQGTLLDVDHGTYPFVTSSNATVGGAMTGSGVGPTHIDSVIGVVKAYTTRVGEGPFPTQFPPVLLKQIQERGEEFGATTGRPRRCGWFDSVVVRHAARVNGLTEMAVMKMDILSGLEKLNIATAYRINGKKTPDYPHGAIEFMNAQPVYEAIDGWKEDITKARKWKDLPANARRYIKRIEELIEVPITIVSVGSKRDQTIIL